MGIPAFLQHWSKYAGNDYRITLAGYSTSPWAEGYATITGMPIDNYIIGRQEDFPANRWSDSLMRVLNNAADETFILMLEDYLLVRNVDNLGVRHLYDYVSDRQYVLRADLTNDRMWANGGTRYLYGYNTYGHCGHLDLVRSFVGSDYQMSLWGCIFNRDVLRRFLVPGETAQQIELNGTSRVNNVGDSVLVLGTRQSPVKHINLIQGGGLNTHEITGLPGLEEDDRAYIMELLKEQTK